MKQLFKVQICFFSYIYTDTVESVEKMVADSFPKEYQDRNLFTVEVYKPDLKTIQEDKCGNCVPIGSIENKTCEEILRKEQNENSL